MWSGNFSRVGSFFDGRVRAGKKSTEGKKSTPISLVFEPRASM